MMTGADDEADGIAQRVLVHQNARYVEQLTQRSGCVSAQVLMAQTMHAGGTVLLIGPDSVEAAAGFSSPNIGPPTKTNEEITLENSSVARNRSCIQNETRHIEEMSHDQKQLAVRR